MKAICLFAIQSYGQSFHWAHRFGGTANESGYKIAVDSDHNVVLCGTFQSSFDADPASSVYTLNPVGVDDIFIQKLDSSGNLIWAGSIGCAGYSMEIHDVNTDDNDTIYVCGAFYGGGDFDPGQGVYNLPAGGGLKAFFMKLDPSGNLVWVKHIGTGFTTRAKSIVTDEVGSVYVTGHFSGFLDLNPDTALSSNVSSGNGEDFYLIKLDPFGNFLWGFDIGDGYTAQSNYLKYKNGKIYVTGHYYNSIDFDPGAGTTILPGYTASDNFFVASYDTTGVLSAANAINEPSNDEANKLDVDQFGNIFISGTFNGATDFDPSAGTFILTSVGYDGFIASYTPSWQLRWAHGFGSSVISNIHFDRGKGIELSNSGNVFFTGTFKDTADFDPGIGLVQLIADSANTFLCSYDNFGNFRWIRGYKGSEVETGSDLSVTSNDNLYFTGAFQDLMVADSVASVSLVSNGGSDAFLMRYADVLTGVNELNVPYGKVAVFPNPSSGYVSFTQFDPKKAYIITVYDLAGNQIQQQKFIGFSEFDMNLEVQSGLYNIRFDTQDEYFISRIQILK